MSVTTSNGSVLLLFERYYERVYCFVRRSLDPSSAEDVAQEVFVRLMNIGNLESRSISVSYLIKIADNLIKRRHRRMRRFEAILASEPTRSGVLRAMTGEHGEENQRDLDGTCDRVMGSLPGGESDAVRLVVCEGLSYENAARSLDVKVSTLNNWKFRGLQRLKQHAELPMHRHTGREPRAVESRGKASQGAL